MSILKGFTNLRVKIFILAFAISVGGAIRLLPVLNASFPLNDGGLFYTMTRELIDNGFRLPQFSAYNHLNIPYAYPPLGFYLSGYLSVLTGWELLDIFRILPAIFTVLTIPAFYLFAREMIKDDLQVAIATFFFACLPYTFNWLIMGGGITRAPVFLLFLLALTCFHRLYTKPETKYIYLTSILSSLIVLTHPETALYSVAAAIVFFVFYGRNKRGVIRSLIVIIITFVATAPWWITVLRNHGFLIFGIASSSGDYNWESIKEFLLFDLTGERTLPIMRILSIIGIIYFLVKKDFLFPVLLITLYFADPRSANRALAPILAILAATATIQLLQGILPKPARQPDKAIRSNSPKLIPGLLLGWFSLIMIASAFAEAILIPRLTLNEVQNLEWISRNTDVNDRFLIITSRHPMADPLSEWFPALTSRSSAATVQGYEWIEQPNLAQRIQINQDLQICLVKTPECFETWLSKNNEKADYLLLPSRSLEVDNQNGDTALSVLLKSYGYPIIFKSEAMQIFQISH